MFGISTDTVQLHRAFAQSERLNFALLADPAKQVTRAYGVLGENGLARRVTFIIGPDGTLRAIDGGVDREFTGSGLVGGGRISRHGENLALLLSDWKAQPGMRVPNFFLPNYDGRTVSPLPPDRKAAVVVFLGTKCPLSRAHAAMLRELALNPVYKDASFLGISPGADETAASVREFAMTYQLPFPIARDPFNEVTDRFEAKETPAVWVLDGRGVVRYRGRPDGRPGTHVRRELRPGGAERHPDGATRAGDGDACPGNRISLRSQPGHSP